MFIIMISYQAYLQPAPFLYLKCKCVSYIEPINPEGFLAPFVIICWEIPCCWCITGYFSVSKLLYVYEWYHDNKSF